MHILLASPAAITANGNFNKPLIDALIAINSAGNPVELVSNHDKPEWFDQAFKGTNVNFVKNQGRQNGSVIKEIAGLFNCQTHDIIVLAVSEADMLMAKNGRALLIAADWSTDKRIKSLGIKISDSKQLIDVFNLINGWNGHWWYEGTSKNYSVKALVDLSQYGKDFTQQLFAGKLVQTVKQGGAQLNALLTVTARSLLIDGFADFDNLFWAVYPSSSSKNNGTEVLSEFTSRLRTTVSKVRFERNGEPLFIRHKPSIKRSGNKKIDRFDPMDQVTSIHLNPSYKTQIIGRNVVVIDDCTTYGLSFAVASAFLRKAGAKSVTGIALGKFGKTIQAYDLEITSDPFKPVAPKNMTIKGRADMQGNNNGTAQQVLQQIIK
ncbi:phosphoribosyltransferase [Pseudomonas aeruginosa]|uniref:phosphoribosyltransferase n=1 Tax=Pseudomonas aeruginosa TaxID=287 RepID=UPI000A3782A9|nr:phosphoribosyltransferase [Pseudomonas aeruginosa]ELP1284081.1 phosphoribosyltransferase [Pseudomonas aeruginosa]MBV5967712.1 phosphoribosyltransferase [Pseudomonas aeruginosa]MCO3268085.1 phosphoribosyltransferase [Pseudomonas aeruginosa]MCT4843203.1 phosphoribosyltransferase [Pseudomonas aeruginosa]MDG3700219.1 phosphoribosyltransferase [Pseudomonas aeruginosa]